MNENELVKKLYENESEAYEYIMNTYSKLLWAIAGGVLYQVGTEQDIEECISDVFIKLWGNPKAFNPNKGSLKSFLAAVTKNKALDRYRQLTRVKINELNDAMCAGNDDLMEYIVKQEMTKELYEAIDLLKEPDKEIMVRRYFFDEKPSTIAKIISIPVKEVENRLFNSKSKLRKSLIHKEAAEYGI